MFVETDTSRVIAYEIMYIVNGCVVHAFSSEIRPGSHIAIQMPALSVFQPKCFMLLSTLYRCVPHKSIRNSSSRDKVACVIGV